MKFNYLIKATPFLSTLLIIILFSISNQKENTRLRILLWETPSLSLGSYIALSTGTGFILSYLLTSNLAKRNQIIQTTKLKFKEEDRYDDSTLFTENGTKKSYEKTLIERDPNEPLPTVNASFRIIGRKERINTNYSNNKSNYQYNTSTKFDEEYYQESKQNDNLNQASPSSSDWSDESFSSW